MKIPHVEGVSSYEDTGGGGGGGDLPLGWSNLFWLQVFSQGRVHICLGLFVCMCV